MYYNDYGKGQSSHHLTHPKKTKCVPLLAVLFMLFICQTYV